MNVCAAEYALTLCYNCCYVTLNRVTALKRRFYAAPSPETAVLEQQLRDPANVVFAHIASKLYAQVSPTLL
jgi:hypothetical protein